MEERRKKGRGEDKFRRTTKPISNTAQMSLAVTCGLHSTTRTRCSCFINGTKAKVVGNSFEFF